MRQLSWRAILFYNRKMPSTPSAISRPTSINPLDPIWDIFCIPDHRLILISHGETHAQSWESLTTVQHVVLVRQKGAQH